MSQFISHDNARTNEANKQFGPIGASGFSDENEISKPSGFIGPVGPSIPLVSSGALPPFGSFHYGPSGPPGPFGPDFSSPLTISVQGDAINANSSVVYEVTVANVSGQVLDKPSVVIVHLPHLILQEEQHTFGTSITFDGAYTLYWTIPRLDITFSRIASLIVRFKADILTTPSPTLTATIIQISGRSDVFGDELTASATVRLVNATFRPPSRIGAIESTTSNLTLSNLTPRIKLQTRENKICKCRCYCKS